MVWLLAPDVDPLLGKPQKRYSTRVSHALKPRGAA
jgi:hypothetical protein